MRISVSILAALALSACVAARSAPAETAQQASTALPGPVSYDVSSWGRLLLRWQVNPDGSGEIWRGERLGKGKGAVRKYRLTMDAPTLRAFAAQAEPLRTATAAGIDCQHQITDQPYGAIAWDYPAGKQSYPFNAGCRSTAADAAMDRIRALSEIVENRTAIEPEPYEIDPGSS